MRVRDSYYSKLLKELDFLRAVNGKTHPVMDEDIVFYNKNKSKISLNNPTTTYRSHRGRILSQGRGQKRK